MLFKLLATVALIGAVDATIGLQAVIIMLVRLSLSLVIKALEWGLI